MLRLCNASLIRRMIGERLPGREMKVFEISIDTAVVVVAVGWK